MFYIHIFSLLHQNPPLNQQRRQLSNHPAPHWWIYSFSPSRAMNNPHDQLHQTPEDPLTGRTRPNPCPRQTSESELAQVEVQIFFYLNLSLLCPLLWYTKHLRLPHHPNLLQWPTRSPTPRSLLQQSQQCGSLTLAWCPCNINQRICLYNFLRQVWLRLRRPTRRWQKLRIRSWVMKHHQCHQHLFLLKTHKSFKQIDVCVINLYLIQ